MAHPPLRPRLLLRLMLPLLVMATPVAAQQDSVTVVAGPAYEAGDLHRWLLGNGYRDLWVTPIRVQVLDLDREAGGLTAVERGGNVQTMGLRFRAADGSEYNFRSVDKELTPALPPFAQETLLDFIRQDVTSAQMPLAPIVATPLLDAVGVLNPEPRLVVLPDHPRLGEFRAQFAGMLGTFEHHPNEIEEGVGGFAGSVEVKSTEDMLDDVEDGPADRIDTRAFLTARLVDMLIGDWDRHEGQWRWARYDRDGTRWWVPIPEDRDYAFVDYGGNLLILARAAGLARLVSFDDEYSSLRGMMANSLEMNRRLLAELPRAAWDSIATSVQARITDDVIADALNRVPPAVRTATGNSLEAKLRVRRDRLPELADRFYLFMSDMVEVHSTDAAEVAEIDRRSDGSVDVAIRASNGTPVFRRTFLPDETKEIRIDLHGGDDAATVTGDGGPITLRILGGGGDDRLQDLARGSTVLYDSRGENELIPGRHTRVDRRDYEPPPDSSGLLPDTRRDWGRSSSFYPLGGWRSHAGIVVGAGMKLTRYGFRYDPRKSRHTVSAVVAPLEGRGALEYEGELRRENSDRWLELRGQASTLNAVRFHGFGNDSEDADDASRVWLTELIFEPRFHLPLWQGAEVVTGAAIKYTDPSFAINSPVETLRPLGTESTGQVQATLGFLMDNRDSPWFPRSGSEVEVEARAAPPLWDLDSAYGRVDGTASTFLSLPLWNGPVLAMRGGGTKLWGDFPFHEAAFAGGSHSLRGFQRERYAGDAMAFGNAELRQPLIEMELLVRGNLGVSGIVDVARVFVDGESPGGWHRASGGSIWFATPALSVSGTYAYGEGHRFYADIGLPF
ncbi:MAG TPA: BamA/TamA family outer membrane protein [Longimicrobiaceae bacterium]